MDRFNLLLRLSLQTWTPASDCDSAALTELKGQGLARVMFTQAGVDGIELTTLGWAEVARVQERVRESSVHDEQLHEVVRLVKDMRRLQRQYFQAGPGPAKKAVFDRCIIAERDVDRAISKIQAPSFDLEGGAHA